MIKLSVEVMTYKEASRYLGKSVNTLQQAIERGVLTPLPRAGRERHLLSEQVKIFKDKPIALASLTQDEYQIWENTVKITTGILPKNPRVIPIDNEQDGYEQGKRFGRNYRKGILDAIREKDASLEEELNRPLAI